MVKKTVLILAASSDIGMAYIQFMLDKEPDSIVVAQYRKQNLVLDELKQKYDNSIDLYQCDLSNPVKVQNLITYVKEKYVCPTHILHLPAQGIYTRRFKDTVWAEIYDDMEIQVHSLFEILKEFLPIMSKRKFGRIAVMLTSYTLGRPPKFISGYVIVKEALYGLVRSIASEYSDKGVTINGLSPEMIKTKFLNNMDERQIEINAQNSMVGRNMHIDEVVLGIDYLLADGNSYTNGINLNMSGGNFM